MFAKFAVNKTEAEVQMIDNRLCIVVGGWRGITEEELKHPDIVYALRKDWIELLDKEPKKPESPPRRKVKTIGAQDPEYAGEKTPGAKVSKIGS